jgi:hypothetical protein
VTATRAPVSTTNSVAAIDIHMHVYPTREAGEREKRGYEIWEYGPKTEVRFSSAGGDPDDAVASLHDAGATRAVIAHLYKPDSASADPMGDVAASNRWVCVLAQQHPEFVPYVCADPVVAPGRLVVDHVRDMVENHGARGVKLHPVVQRLDLADVSNWPLFGMAERMGLPVLSHSGTSRAGSSRSDPDAFRPVLAAFPRLRLLLAHLGGGEWRQAVALAHDYPDVMFDCCEIIHWLGAPRAPSPVEFVTLLRTIGINRVMAGSDFPWYDIASTIDEVAALPGLTDGERTAIVAENAATFLSANP